MQNQTSIRKLRDSLKARPEIVVGFALAFVVVLIVGSILLSFHGDNSSVLAFDQSVLQRQLEFRSPSLNAVMIDITGIGSEVSLYFFSIFSVLLLVSMGEKVSALQFAIAAYGSSFLTSQLKHGVARARPQVISHLVDIGGLSFPSGHACSSAAIFLTSALLASYYFRKKAQRILFFTAVALLVSAIAYSRVYLGVHNPSDVVAGALLGTGWALLVMAIRELYWPHKRVV